MLRQPLGALSLMRRVGVRVQKADRHRFDVFGREPFPDGVDFALVEREQNGSVHQHALAHLNALRARDERTIRRRLDVINQHAVTAADDQNILVPGRDHDCHFRAIALERSVGSNGRAVHHSVNFSGFDAEHVDAGKNSLGLVLRRRRLQNLQLPLISVE